jgi:hypothetical protein
MLEHKRHSVSKLREMLSDAFRFNPDAAST